ncbi:MAG: hypothetical protein AAF074_18165 [Pseudomonadota bacterium]
MSDAFESLIARLAVPAVALGITVAAGAGILSVLGPGQPPLRAANFVVRDVGEGEATARAAAVREAAEAFAARPLFHASRRPWAPEAKAPAPAPAAPAKPRLLGIVGYQGRYLALVLPADGGPARRVGAGSTIGAWQVLAVGPEAVELSSERGGRAVLALKRAE